MKLELWSPVKPLHINRPFGDNPLNPDGTPYYAKFRDQFGNPYKGHDGTDFMAVHGQPVYAAMAGLATLTTDPRGGEGVYITSQEALDYAGGTCWFQAIHFHLIGDTDPKYPKPFQGTIIVKAGDLIGYANNTGAPYESNGDHLHFGLKPVDQNGKLVAPGNGFNGAIDPSPYWNHYFAVDHDKVLGIYQQIISFLKQKLNFNAK